MSAPQPELRIYLHPSAFVQRFTVESGSVLLHKIFQKCIDGKVKIVISVWTLNQAIEIFEKKYRDEAGRSDLDVSKIAFGTPTPTANSERKKRNFEKTETIRGGDHLSRAIDR